MAKTANDLKGDAKTRYASYGSLLGAAHQALIDFNRAVDGPGIVQGPTNRIMTGAVNAAQAIEQAVVAASSNRNQPLNEFGTRPLQ